MTEFSHSVTYMLHLARKHLAYAFAALQKAGERTDDRELQDRVRVDCGLLTSLEAELLLIERRTAELEEVQGPRREGPIYGMPQVDLPAEPPGPICISCGQENGHKPECPVAAVEGP